MNILYLAPTPFFSVRGAPLVTYDTIVHLTQDGHDVDLLTFPFGEDRELPGLKITRCGTWLPIRRVSMGASLGKAALDSAIFLHVLWRLLSGRLGFGKTYDLVYALDESAFSSWLLAWLLPCPVIYDMDDTITEKFEINPRLKGLAKFGRFADSRCIRVATVVVVQCEAYAERVATIAPHKQIVIVPDLPIVTAKMIQSSQLRWTMDDVPFEHPVFLYVGNFGPHQGIDLMIAAFHYHQRSGNGGSLVIAGGQSDEVRKLARINPEIRFLGTVDPQRLPELYREADVLVAPRKSGSNTPMKIYDYMHSGKPIVATNLRTHTQVLDEECAILVPGSVEGLADGMRQAVTDQRHSVKIGRRAQERVESITSEEIFRERLRQAVAQATGNTAGETKFSN